MTSDFIDLFPNSLTPKFCDDVIRLFEKYTDDQKDGLVGYGNQRKLVNSIKKCTEININGKHWSDVDKVFYESCHENVLVLRDKYRGLREMPVSDCGYRIKRYLPDGTEWFDWHHDVTDFSQANRYIVCLWYLNTVEEGGETKFMDQEKTISPQQGLMISFPPAWTHVHCGRPPISGPKYIVTTWIQFTGAVYLKEA